jgi:hypothetical protein
VIERIEFNNLFFNHDAAQIYWVDLIFDPEHPNDSNNIIFIVFSVAIFKYSDRNKIPPLIDISFWKLERMQFIEDILSFISCDTSIVFKHSKADFIAHSVFLIGNTQFLSEYCPISYEPRSNLSNISPISYTLKSIRNNCFYTWFC